ncbi:hypothetical protein [Actinomadura livida]|uniref:Uncharacterized protein n=1 Tax=Actinomadura livida TaxID=79909 RepID=A0A7W7IIL3_9ACTN|nr:MULTISPECIES: hypothetical protein [Actinomadura]MBB4777675.1 hypothetical protein [Actinomadura catellatispora]GGT99466.1 hypothetical protein GCM10010208_24000 [Actinomadura livida]
MTSRPLPQTLTYLGERYRLVDGRIVLNWRDRPVSTRPRPCHYCHNPAHFTDDAGRPVHKTCHEVAITADRLVTGGDVAA